MPSSTLPAASTPPSQLSAQTIHKRFANRPTLFSVVFNALRDRLLEQYPTLKMDLRSVKLAIPQPSGHYTFQLMANVAVEHVLNPQLLDLSDQRELPFYLTEKIPNKLKPLTPPLIDMQVVAKIIAELPPTVHIYFQQALADYWSVTDAQGISHWQWLSEFLNGQMTAAAASQSELTQTQREMLAIVAARPERLPRLRHATPRTYAYFIETTLTRAGKEQRLLTPDLLLVCDHQILLYSVAGAVQVFDSIDAFAAAWGHQMKRRYTFDSLTWRRNEPDGNVFEQQAGLILNQQLEDLATLSFQGHSERTMERRLDRLTDPALLFTKVTGASPAALERLSKHLPEWITQASVDDRFAYHRHLQEMAQVLQQNQGRSFNDGIENIHTFSRHALRKQMQADHGAQDPDDVVLDFAVAAGYPGGAGIIDHVRMSLTELALKNLAGKPKGNPKVSSKSGKTLPDWLSADYILGSSGLIQRVDIGTTYPQTIKDLLLSDTVDARRRETLFTRELKVKLPMQALEYKIRQQYGVSATGYLYVKALLGDTVSDRTVDGQEIVLRPLALCRKPGATPDTIDNMFIIEPRDTLVGPHLLYRPFYVETLHEYPTRQALLDDIATPSDLQKSVLTWLTDKARPIFDHGGIKEPHIVRLIPGDEFRPYEKPAPATLAVDVGAQQWLQSQADGKLFNQLFFSTAQAMVDLADRNSVSNSESRWAIVMEGAWLLFNTLLLPLVQGPAMLAGWLLVLVSSLEQDLAGLDSDDPTTKELALIDLLLNAAMVLLHAASSPNQQPLRELAPQDSNLHLAPWLRTTAPLPETMPPFRQAAPAFSGEPPATGHTALDFSRSLPSAKTSAKLLDLLRGFNVPWPEALPEPQASGPLKGLYRIDAIWHASVGGLLFQVSVVPGFGDVFLVDPKRAHHPGFQLVSDGQGHWRLQRGARLEGGMPKERVQQWSEENRRLLNQLEAQAQVLRQQSVQLIKTMRETREALQLARHELDAFNEPKLKKLKRVLWKLTLADVPPETRAGYVKKFEEQRTAMLDARARLKTRLDKYLDALAVTAPVLRELVQKRNEQMAADMTNTNFPVLRSQAAMLDYNNWSFVFDYLIKSRLDLLELASGEHIDELSKRVNDELSRGITDGYEDFLTIQRSLLEIEDRQIPVAKEIQTLLDQADPALRKDLLSVTPSDQYISPAPLEQSRMQTLLELAVDRSFQSGSEDQLALAQQVMDPQLLQSVLAHSEMRTRSGYSTTEKKAILKDVLEHYKRVENAFISLSDLQSGYIRDQYREPFLKQFGAARSSLESQLADLILVEEGFLPEQPPEKHVNTKARNKKVIKTRMGSLVGDLRPSDSGAESGFVDIIDSSTGQTIATYQEQATAGLWEEVNSASSAQATLPEVPPAPVPQVRSLKKIKEYAQKIIGDRERIEGRIRTQKKKLADPDRREDLTPLDWDDWLTEPASRLEALAKEIKSSHATDPKAIQLADGYLREVASMRKQAQLSCSEGYLLQRPRAAKIKYLLEHGFVEITLVQTLIPLKAGDFLTEYAVHDKSKVRNGKPDNDNALWYAHFHYPTADGAGTPYGHLKPHAERKFTRKELFERNKQNARAVIELTKEGISPALAKALFLGV